MPNGLKIKGKSLRVNIKSLKVSIYYSDSHNSKFKKEGKTRGVIIHTFYKKNIIQRKLEYFTLIFAFSIKIG